MQKKLIDKPQECTGVAWLHLRNLTSRTSFTQDSVAEVVNYPHKYPSTSSLLTQ